MEIQLNMNAVNQIAKGVTIYPENQIIESISLIVKGRVIVHKNGIRAMIGSGNFIGVCDVHKGKYAVNYIAYDNLLLYTFPIKTKDDIETILFLNKEYGGLMVASLSQYVVEIENISKELLESAVSLYEFLIENYEAYKKIGRQTGYSTVQIEMLENLEELRTENGLNQKVLEYYRECTTIPLDVQKAFYSKSNLICLYHVEEQAELIQTMIEQCTESSCYMYELIDSLMGEQEDCLFKVIAKLAIELKRAGIENKVLVDMVDSVVDKINQMEKLFVDKVGNDLMIDRSQMENIYFTLLSGKEHVEIDKNEEILVEDGAINEVEAILRDSTEQILQFSGLDSDKCTEFKNLLCEFKKMKDKYNTDDDARKLRKKITNLFYELYEQVFLKDYATEEKNRVIDLFLNYGFIDEKLLSEERLVQLYHLEDQEKQTGPCMVYNMKEWLTLIYEGKKEPSKNEFDLDYTENLREMRKGKRITEAEANKMLKDGLLKLQYEINNMFRYNNRIVSGEISTFIPLLNEDMFVGSLLKSYLTGSQVNAAIKRILMVDYSIFYREVLYVDEEKGIKKEYRMQEVFPDIILMPIHGVNAVMWQEISGKRRNTSGRILMAAFTEGNIEDILVTTFGRFRWELCRTLQGAGWNNIKYKSLTSEYSDYIQFYRKNRDLSEERKEKLKMQIQKGRNNTREIFTMDYELWINNESKGAIRLNKTVRMIMATYVPFPKELRTKLLSQPLFEDAMAKFIRENQKKLREIENRYRLLEKEGVQLTEELIETRKFYLEM